MHYLIGFSKLDVHTLTYTHERCKWAFILDSGKRVGDDILAQILFLSGNNQLNELEHCLHFLGSVWSPLKKKQKTTKISQACILVLYFLDYKKSYGGVLFI